MVAALPRLVDDDPEVAARARQLGAFVGVGAALSSATQLRLVPGLGVGELILLAVTVLLALDHGWRIERERSSPVSQFMGRYIVVGACASVPALLLGYQSDGLIRDMLALVFDGLLIAAITFHPARPQVISRAIYVYVWVFTSVNALLLVASFVTQFLGPIQLYDGARFLGWSQNPNQLATGAGAALIFAVAMFRRRAAPVNLVLAVAALAVGFKTGSDGLHLALLTGAGIGLFSARRLPKHSTIRTLLDIATMLVAAIVVLRFGDIIRYSNEVRNLNGQGSDRLVLWTNCVHKIVQSPLIGRGFGPHSFNPAYEVTTMQECHNSYLDATTVAGIPMGLMLVWTFWRCRRFRTVGGAAADVALSMMFVVLFFSNMTRHPAFWLVMMWVVSGHEPARADVAPWEERARAALVRVPGRLLPGLSER